MPLVRRGQAEDLHQIAEIQSSSPQAAQWDVADYLLYDLHVATCENRITGYLVTRFLGDSECEILNIAVAPEYRRKGVGKALLSELLEGYRGAVLLEVRESNLTARNLYKSMGFQEIGSRKDYYDSPPETAIVLKFHSC